MIPSPAWRRLDLAGLQGTLMIVGGTDSGKTTFARYLFLGLCHLGRRAAYLDGVVRDRAEALALARELSQRRSAVRRLRK